MKKKKFTILIVDDHEEFLRIHSHILQHEGYHIETATTGKDCLEAIEKLNPDLVLLDVILPDINGIEICQRIKANLSTQHILVLLISSIEIESKSQLTGLEAGADGYLVKSISNQMLLAHVRMMERIKRSEDELRDATTMLEKGVEQRTEKLEDLNKKLLNEIAERKEIETTLQRREEYYRTLFQNNPIPLFVYDRTTLAFLAVNDTAIHQYGYSEQEFLSMMLPDIHPQEEKPVVLQTVKTGFESIRYPGPLHHQKKDGTIIDVELTTHDLMFDEKFARLVMIINITERKQVEEALLEEQHLVNMLLDNVPDRIYFKDLDSRFIRINKEQTIKFGLSDPAQAVGKTDFDFFTEEHARIAFENEQTIIRTGKPMVNIEERETWFDRRDTWVSTTKMPLYSKIGKIVGTFGVSRDITLHKQAEEYMRRAAEGAHAIFWHSIVIDTQDVTQGAFGYLWNIQYANLDIVEKFLDLPDYPTHDLRDRYHHSWLTVDRKQMDIQSADALRKGLDGYTQEFRLMDAKGKLHWMYGDVHIKRLDKNTSDIAGITIEITERKNAEENLRRATEGTHAIFWHATVTKTEDETQGTYGYNWDTQYANLDVVQKFLDLPDYPTHDLSERFYNSWFEEDRKAMDRQSAEAFRNGLDRYTQEFRLQNAKGEIHWMYVEARVQRLNERTFDVGGIDMDITERKRSEEILRQSEERYRLISSVASDYVFTSQLDQNGNLIHNWVGGAFEAITGYTFEEYLKVGGWRALVYPEDREQDDKDLIELQNNRNVTTDIRTITKSGKTFWVRVYAHPIWDAEKNMLVGIFGAVQNIDEQKRSAMALRESEERYRSMIENSNDLIQSVTTDGRFLFVNPKWLNVLGYSQEEVDQLNLFDIIHPDSIPHCQLLFKKILQGEDFPHIEATFVGKDGRSIFIEGNASPRFLEGKVIATQSFFHDVTEQKTLQQELIQAQKMESIGTLAGGIAHDFNNILGIILGHVTLLEKHLANDPRHQSNLNAIQRAGERGAALVKQILTFARKTNTLFEPVDIRELSEEIFSMLSQTFPKNISLTNNIQRELPNILADRSQIHQVLLNLCVNARDAMPNGGAIILSAEICTKAQVQEQFPHANQPAYVCLSVADTGEGMDNTTRLRVFDPFFTTKPQGKGTGLGLSVVFGVVEAHNGFIDLSSEVGRGTTFHIYFPASVHIDQSLEAAPLTETVTVGGSETILLAEDEDLLLEMICYCLESNGYRVYRAEDGLKAVEIYKSHKEEIHLVVTDVGLPGITGEEEFKKLKEINPQVKVIFASGFFDPNTQSALIEAGAVGFLQKPYKLQDVLKLLREVLDNKQ